MSDFSSTYPTQSPVFAFDAKAGKLDSRISFSRSDSTPSNVHFRSNEKHLSSLNLTTNSENFTAWTETNATATANTTASPDGNTTADTLTGNAGTSGKYLESNTIPASDPVISVYAKAGTHSYIQITDNALSTEFANFDLTNGTVGTVGADATAAIQAVGSTGWYRCIMRVTQTSTAFAWRVVMIDSSTAARHSTTSSTGTVQLWGGMMTELGDLTNVVAYQSSGSQAHRSYSSTLKSVANSGDPRFEFDPITGNAEGLLVESQATNSYANSSDMTGSSGYRINVDSNISVSPMGDLTADALRLDSNNASSHYKDYNFTAAASTVYTFSVYVKSAGLSHICVRPKNNWTDNAQYIFFNLSTGAVTGGTGVTEDVGGGWWRCSVTATSAAATTSTFRIYITESGTTTTVATGDSYRSIIGTGLQVEASSTASSLISTSGTAATRAADSCSVATSSFYTGGPISITAESNTSDLTSASKIVFRLDAGDAVFTQYFSYALLYSYVFDGSGDQALQYPVSPVVAGTTYKTATRVNTDDMNSAADGVTQTVDTTGVIPDLAGATLHIGGISGNYGLNGNLKNLKVFSAPLTDTNLSAITS